MKTNHVYWYVLVKYELITKCNVEGSFNILLAPVYVSNCVHILCILDSEYYNSRDTKRHKCVCAFYFVSTQLVSRFYRFQASVKPSIVSQVHSFHTKSSLTLRINSLKDPKIVEGVKFKTMATIWYMPMADSGTSRCANLTFSIFCKKLHENERNRTERGHTPSACIRRCMPSRHRIGVFYESGLFIWFRSSSSAPRIHIQMSCVALYWIERNPLFLISYHYFYLKISLNKALVLKHLFVLNMLPSGLNTLFHLILSFRHWRISGFTPPNQNVLDFFLGFFFGKFGK